MRKECTQHCNIQRCNKLHRVVKVEFSPPMKMSMSRKIRKNEEKGNLHTGAGNTFSATSRLPTKPLTTLYHRTDQFIPSRDNLYMQQTGKLGLLCKPVGIQQSYGQSCSYNKAQFDHNNFTSSSWHEPEQAAHCQLFYFVMSHNLGMCVALAAGSLLLLVASCFVHKFLCHQHDEQLKSQYGILPYVNFPLCQLPFGQFPLCQFQLCQFPLCQFPTMSISHYVNSPLCQFPTMSISHYVNSPLCQFPTMSIPHYVNFPLCQFPTMSISHYVNFPLVNVDKVDKQEIWTNWEIIMVRIDKVGI